MAGNASGGDSTIGIDSLEVLSLAAADHTGNWPVRLAPERVEGLSFEIGGRGVALIDRPETDQAIADAAAALRHELAGVLEKLRRQRQRIVLLPVFRR